ncbi:MAG: hypothetical protein RIC35_06765 [Marinoscillum sp.]
MRLFLIFLLVGVLTSCEDSPCSNGVCTHQYVIVGLELYDLDGERIQLDSSKTSLNSKVIFSKDYSTEASTYHSVITDSEYVEVDFSGTEVTFTGWLDGQQIVEQDFIIGKDCCHIEKIEGPKLSRSLKFPQTDLLILQCFGRIQNSHTPNLVANCEKCTDHNYA